MKNLFIQKCYGSIIFLFIVSSIIEINAPIVIYFVQLVGLLGLLLLRFMIFPRINLNRIILVFGIITLIVIYSMVQNGYLIYKEIFWLNTIRTTFWIVVCIFMYDLLTYIPKQTLLKIINFCIVISSIAVYIQIISYYVFSYTVDLSIILGGEGVRSGISLGNLSYRPTGLTSEPAIHTGIVFGLLVLKYLLDQKVNFISLLGLSSIALSFSTLGILLVFCYLLIIFTQKVIYFFLGVILMLIGIFYFWDMLMIRYDSFMVGGDSSNQIKLDVFNAFFENVGITLFGFGFIGKDSNAPHFYEALYDMTLFFNFFIYFGVVLGSLLLIASIIIILRSNFNLREKLLLCLGLIKLSGPTFLFFNVYILILFLINSKREIKIDENNLSSDRLGNGRS